ncbi:glutamyl-tRNA synthetase [Cordyceps javanica]|uniref:glutamate--tRNA ligase n=1 Tax=Cordyceps javanica TaxID=43265 RepID=A0A545VLJ5_9HYPO|nr:glutamyl-tRNA synthetase [Cordyceps javanica]TQW02599.1 glutamyl-tRNA synthetase [Cordyceps javanica]
MPHPKLLEILRSIETPDFKTNELAFHNLDQFLTLRTFLEGYTLSEIDERIWKALRLNKVAFGVLRRNIFLNVTRWFTHLEWTYPALRQSTKAPPKAAAGTVTDQPGGRYNIKLQDTENGVVTRFPPEPSGYLHIGHAKAAFLNDYFAHDAFSGSMILRFDDTNPKKEKQEFEDAIIHDLGLLGVQTKKVTYTSDYFESLYELCQKLISEGNAYADDTEYEVQKKDRYERRPSARRDRPATESLELFKEMRDGTEIGKRHCIRARIKFDSSNGSMRDPIVYRFPSWDADEGPQPHHRTGWTWKIYPTYDFACPLVDSIEGVTHALRTTEYADRNEQYHWFLDALGLRRVYLWDFARINFIKTFLSKRKLTKIVDTGKVDGWDDPRMPTVRGILRRGLTVEALREFMLKQGPSRNVVSMDWTTLWAMNKKIIDPTAARHTAVEIAGKVLLTIEGAALTPWKEDRAKHPKNAGVGTKVVTFASKVLVELADAATLQDGEEVTLMGWGNVIVKRISKSADGGIECLEVKLNPGGDFSKTKKIHWLAAEGTQNSPAQLWEFDNLLTKDSLTKTDEFAKFLNPVTATMVDALVGADCEGLVEGDIIQLERKGYFRVDKAIGKGPDGKAVMFKIPTGTGKV